MTQCIFEQVLVFAHVQTNNNGLFLVSFLFDCFISDIFSQQPTKRTRGHR